MAKRRPRQPQNNTAEPASSFEDPRPELGSLGADYSGLDSDEGLGLDSSGVSTGRKIVTILSDDPDDKKKVIKYFSARDVKDLLQTADYEESAFDVTQASSSEAIVLDHLPILILNESPNVRTALSAQAATVEDEETQRLFVVEDELRHFPSCRGTGPEGLEGMGLASSVGPNAGFAQSTQGAKRTRLPPYHEGYLRGVQSLVSGLLGSMPSHEAFAESDATLSPADFAQCFSDSSSAAWGLQATGASVSGLSGRGIRVAILDTGFEFGHADQGFASRVVANASFVGGTAQDHNGHGTHVAGTACGPRAPGLGTRRYGIASEADILVARVLGPNGGDDSSVLGGINWALGQGCNLINMSLGPRVCRLSTPFSASHERAARIALRNGVLMIAAAGNNSSRPHMACPVVGPAAAPSIVAVAAVDRCGRVASFSNQGQDQNGGEINFAAPGVSVFSAWINPTRHRSIPGTSMAAPHVTGIAALVAQETGLRGLPLYREIRQRVVNIGGERRDVGNGFIRV